MSIIRTYEIRKVINSIRSRGVLTTLKVLKSIIIDLLFDVRYGTDTMRFIELDNLEVNSVFKNNGTDYIPTRARHIRTILNMQFFSEQDTFVDLGSGKGRTLLIASEYFDKVKGIEFSEELCEIAKRNILVYSGKTGKHLYDRITVVHADVTDYQISDEENIFYMYNPFDETVLRELVKNLEVSINKVPRTVWIIYYYPVHRDVIDKTSIFSINSQINMDGIECIIYKTLHLSKIGFFKK